jgi:uncharacterized protein
LLGLFPIVMLELKYLNPILADLGLNSSVATFVGNLISVALTSFFTMPWSVRGLGWWLFPKTASAAVNVRGIALLALFYAITILLFWKLLPW